MIVIPSIELRAGKVVRLVNGDFAKEHIYSDDPVGVARDFAEQGAEWLHMVDLEGARTGRPRNLDIVKAIVEEIPSLNVQFGGGIRDRQIADEVLALGVNRIVIGSKLVQDRPVAATMVRLYGDRIAAALDIRKGYAAIAGWTEESNVEVRKLAQQVENDGFARIILTDIVKDGAMAGPNVDLIAKVSGACSLPVMSSGGVSSLADLEALQNLQCRPLEAVIVGKAIYERKFSFHDALKCIENS